MKTDGRTWDIVRFKKPISIGGSAHFDIGLIFEKLTTSFQILPLTVCDESICSHSAAIKAEELNNGRLDGAYCIDEKRISVVDKEEVSAVIGSINETKIDELLRLMSRNLFGRYYHEVHKKQQAFKPGRSYIRYAGRVFDADELETLGEACLDFWLTAGRYARQFEQEFCDFLGLKFCLLTNSGSSANLLGVSALTSPKLQERALMPGDEVITTACAFPTTVTPIIQNRLTPVFVDVDIGTYNIITSGIEEGISEKTKAIFLAHTLGNPFDINKILEVCQKYNLWLIEDNCDSLGSKYQDKFTGTFGDIATYSFYPPHHITMGEGGALTTDKIQLKRLIESFRDWGRDCWCDPGCDDTCGKRFGWKLGSLPTGYDHKFIYSHLGYNLKITDMQAAVGVAQLKKLSSFVKARQKNWKFLRDGLERFDSFFILPEPTKNSEPSWFGFALTVRDDAPFSKNDVVEFLESNHIATRMLFSGNIIRHPCFQDVEYRVVGDLENTDAIMKNTFWLGVYPGIDSEMISYILEKFDNFLKKFE
jgi:CDP-6-deoxy-D-xylo-4-hexulose-3-dehydrase